jgi:hypothetical protein
VSVYLPLTAVGSNPARMMCDEIIKLADGTSVVLLREEHKNSSSTIQLLMILNIILPKAV